MKKNHLIPLLGILLASAGCSDTTSNVTATLNADATEEDANAVSKSIEKETGKSAKVIRDENGKVIQVEVSLPELDNEGIEKAKSAINENKGVSVVTVTPTCGAAPGSVLMETMAPEEIEDFGNLASWSKMSGQSFTSATCGDIGSVTLSLGNMKSFDIGELVVQIYGFEGGMVGDLISTSDPIHSTSLVTEGLRMESFNFSASAPVEAGKRYLAVLKSTMESVDHLPPDWINGGLKIGAGPYENSEEAFDIPNHNSLESLSSWGEGYGFYLKVQTK